MTLLERFNSKYEPEPNSGCWLWTGDGNGRGYGVMVTAWDGNHRTRAKAHRLSWQLHNGEIPDGKHVLHKCDVKCCVNPDHLFLGTNADNVNDKVSKGRQWRPIGERHHKAILNPDAVRHIRRKEMTRKQYAALYGCGVGAIDGVLYSNNWSSV